MNRFLDWLFGRSALGAVEHWTPERAEHYTRATYRYLGIRPEPIYPWSRKFRPKAKLQSVSGIREPQRVIGRVG